MLPYLKILNYCIKLTRSVEDGRDLCQEAFTRYLENQYQGDTVLFTIARNMFINEYHRSHRYHLVPYDAIPGAVTYDQDLHDMKVLNDRIDSLSLGKGQAVRLFTEGYTYAEIAAIQGVGIETIKSRIHMGRKKLMELQ